MKASLKPGIEYVHAFTIPENKTVPHLYPEAEQFRSMPQVLATGFMVGLMEWACIEAIAPHLDEGEGSLGIHIDVSHVSATPPGLTVCVSVQCIEVEGRRLTFKVSAHDGLDLIGEGRHQRMVVNWERFNDKVAEKARRAKND
ncbi:MAG: thioesterase family protein [Rhodospirillales bacterium]|nr:thioesterase family protein [Rhodospirillales bacterium]